MRLFLVDTFLLGFGHFNSTILLKTRLSVAIFGTDDTQLLRNTPRMPHPLAKIIKIFSGQFKS